MIYTRVVSLSNNNSNTMIRLLEQVLSKIKSTIDLLAEVKLMNNMLSNKYNKDIKESNDYIIELKDDYSFAKEQIDRLLRNIDILQKEISDSNKLISEYKENMKIMKFKINSIFSRFVLVIPVILVYFIIDLNHDLYFFFLNQ